MAEQQTDCGSFKHELKLKGFKAYEIDSTSPVVRDYTRKDFYKICLNNGKNNVHYADKSFIRKAPFSFLATRIFPTPGKHWLLHIPVMPACFLKTF